MPIYPNVDPKLNSEGSLQISVFENTVAKPAPNSTISVSPSGSNEIIEEIVTDSSGQTQTLNLPAPPLDFSLEPNVDQRPYAEYDLVVTKKGYDQIKIKGVQILPNSIAIQNINLASAPRPNIVSETLVVKEHTLWGDFSPKIPEEDVKPLPASLGYVVLPEPVIPEYIVVHAGVPTDNAAPNYWIRFRDYIKNVASCEIYSTWPTETIKANVLAILSFTLNRVYTEWYRGKGYNFTITSSTAYDHAFSYGRNIFKEISIVVDDIFNNFITKSNIRQPLLTQYCDGKKVSCPNWMTQWGSKTLGDQGYSAIDILKNFYGYDIYLMQAKEVEGLPESYPGTPLQMGSSGQAVRTIQEQLNKISSNYPAIEKVAVDGVFDEKTRIAVENFQNIFHLSSDGIVGPATWYQISNIYVAVTNMAELK